MLKYRISWLDETWSFRRPSPPARICCSIAAALSPQESSPAPGVYVAFTYHCWLFMARFLQSGVTSTGPKRCGHAALTWQNVARTYFCRGFPCLTWMWPLRLCTEEVSLISHRAARQRPRRSRRDTLNRRKSLTSSRIWSELDVRGGHCV